MKIDKSTPAGEPLVQITYKTALILTRFIPKGECLSMAALEAANEFVAAVIQKKNEIEGDG